MSDDPCNQELRRQQQQPPTAYNYPNSYDNFCDYQKVGEVTMLPSLYYSMYSCVAATFVPQMIADEEVFG